MSKFAAVPFVIPAEFPFTFVPVSPTSEAERSPLTIPEETLKGCKFALRAVQSIRDNIIRIAYTEVGMLANKDYVAVAVGQLFSKAYPAYRLKSFAYDEPIRDEDGNRDVNFVVKAIVAVQNRYFSRVAANVDKYCDFTYDDNCERNPHREIRRLVAEKLENMSFLEGKETLRAPFVASAIIDAIGSNVEFGKVFDYDLITHRLVAMTAAALLHGLLRWTSGEYRYIPELDELDARRRDYLVMRRQWDILYEPPTKQNSANEARTRMAVKVIVYIQEAVRARNPYPNEETIAQNAILQRERVRPYTDTLNERKRARIYSALTKRIEDKRFKIGQYGVGDLFKKFEPGSEEAVNAELRDRGKFVKANSPDLEDKLNSQGKLNDLIIQRADEQLVVSRNTRAQAAARS